MNILGSIIVVFTVSFPIGDHMQNKVAIIIPAYKAKFLSATLESICSQTCQDFSLYIGDDCSPEPIYEVVRSFEKRREIYYVRFKENLGCKSLVKQWERCIDLSNEPWIWLFSDDDVMEPYCVEAFLNNIETTNRQCDVYRFNTVVINDRDEICALNPPHPKWEHWMEFTYFWLKGLRSCTLQDLVFSRRAFEEAGGFVDLPLAWGADVTLLVRLGVRHGIGTIGGPRVLFRNSGRNISSLHDRELSILKVKAYMRLTDWLLEFLCVNRDTSFELPVETLVSLTRDSFLDHLERQHIVYSLREIIWISSYINQTWGGNRLLHFLRLSKMNSDTLFIWYRRRLRKG